MKKSKERLDWERKQAGKPKNPKNKKVKERYEKQFGGDQYRGWIVNHPCCACGRPAPCDPHHSRTRGAGGKAEDLVPLCRTCHNSFHTLGRMTFEKKFGIVLAVIAKELWNAFWREIGRSGGREEGPIV